MKTVQEVIIIGAGAVAAEVCSYIDDINDKSEINYKVKGFITFSLEDYEANAKKYLFDAPYLGTAEEYVYLKEDNFILGFSDINGRLKILEQLKDKNLNFITLIHPSCIVAKSAKIGVGNIINPNCVIGPNAVIGDHNVLTSYSFVSHDCVVGNNNSLSTAGLAGRIILGDNNFFGIRVTVIPYVQIGNFNLIQAGMIVDKNVGDNETVFYKYKERITIIKDRGMS